MVMTNTQLMYFRRLWGYYQEDYLYLCRGKLQMNEAQNGLKMLRGKQQVKLIEKCEEALGDVELKEELYLSTFRTDQELQSIIDGLNYAIYEVSNMSTYLQGRLLRGV